MLFTEQYHCRALEATTTIKEKDGFKGSGKDLELHEIIAALLYTKI